MRTLCTTVLIFGVVTGTATSALAQGSNALDRAPLPAGSITAEALIHAPELERSGADRRRDELERWMHDFAAWKAWMEQWGNRREPGWFNEYRTRRQRPDPPAWLADSCGRLVDESDSTAEACAALAEWTADFVTTQTNMARAAAVADDETADKTTWWQHLHLDFGWPAMQGGLSLYGVVGMHATTTVKGRLEVFVAPGAMLLNVPTNDGARAWKFATNYGIAYRLGEFNFLGDRPALLHVNLAKAWLLSAGPDVPTKSTDFVGLSMTFKKKE